MSDTVGPSTAAPQDILFEDTTLHTAAESGNVASALEIMAHKPSLSRKLNRNGLTPLHLFLRSIQSDLNGRPPLDPNGARLRRNLVLCFLKRDKDLARIKGEGGLTPLHYTAQMGDLELLIDILIACPRSIIDVTTENKTFLHIALENNKFDAFILLEDWLLRASFTDASYWKQKLRTSKDINGDTFSDVARNKSLCQVDFKDIGRMLSRDLTLLQFLHVPDPAGTALLALAGVTMSLTFQVVLNPPGGTWRDNYDCRTNGPYSCADKPSHRAGTAIMRPAIRNPFPDF